VEPSHQAYCDADRRNEQPQVAEPHQKPDSRSSIRSQVSFRVLPPFTVGGKKSQNASSILIQYLPDYLPGIWSQLMSGEHDRNTDPAQV
jgi:hypothetical protein